MNVDNKCTARQAPFRGWDACHLENGLVHLVAVPAIGGRVMAYDLGPYPFLFVDPHLAGKTFTAEEHQGDGTLASWKNYGGDKTWPAPQGWENEQQWHGPPDPVLDSGHYTLERCRSTNGCATVRMISPPDRRTGVQITRHFTLQPDSSRVTLQLSFANVKEELIRWSIWDVVQLRAERRLADGSRTHDPECTVTAPLNPDSRFAQGFNVMFGEAENPQWSTDMEHNLFIARYLWRIGKVGIDSPAGWIAFNQGREGYAFVERFPYEADAEYPDEGATVECWTIGSGQVDNLNYDGSDIHLMETEVLGPLQEIAPGDAAHFTIEWAAARCRGPIVAVSDGGCAARPLSVTVSDGYAHLTGHFGVFDRGKLLLRWQGRAGGLVGERHLGQVDPLQSITLDLVEPLATNVAEVALVVAPTQGGTYLLARATL